MSKLSQRVNPHPSYEALVQGALLTATWTTTHSFDNCKQQTAHGEHLWGYFVSETISPAPRTPETSLPRNLSPMKGTQPGGWRGPRKTARVAVLKKDAGGQLCEE